MGLGFGEAEDDVITSTWGTAAAISRGDPSCRHPRCGQTRVSCTKTSLVGDHTEG